MERPGACADFLGPFSITPFGSLRGLVCTNIPKLCLNSFLQMFRPDGANGLERPKTSLSNPPSGLDRPGPTVGGRVDLRAGQASHDGLSLGRPRSPNAESKTDWRPAMRDRHDLLRVSEISL
ncbi:hypothetical protein LA080_011083 [Diaporthe eres]|nr:hypothetical protein LA080_011083 [Diaporthe eres]